MFTLSLAIFQQYFKHRAILSIFQVMNVTNREQNLQEKIPLNSLTAANLTLSLRLGQFFWYLNDI